MRVDQFRYAIEFDSHPDIVLELGSALNTLRKERRARIQFLNVPAAAPPPAPRVVVNTENTLIHIGLNRYEAMIRLPQHIQSSLSSTCDFARRVVDDDLYHLFIEDLGYRWLGLVASLQRVIASPDFDAADSEEYLERTETSNSRTSILFLSPICLNLLDLYHRATPLVGLQPRRPRRRLEGLVLSSFRPDRVRDALAGGKTYERRVSVVSSRTNTMRAPSATALSYSFFVSSRVRSVSRSM